MQRLLLDVHLSHGLADALRRRGFDVVHVADWNGGRWRTATDDDVLVAATADDRILVSRDATTLPDLARHGSLDGHQHAGILLVTRSIADRDIGGQADVITAALQARSHGPLDNLVIFASRRR